MVAKSSFDLKDASLEVDHPSHWDAYLLTSLSCAAIQLKVAHTFIESVVTYKDAALE